jgi:dTDP-4-amino-4,6-dideoxygalactose transaminase
VTRGCEGERIALADLRATDDARGDALRAAVDRVARSGRFVLGGELGSFERALALHEQAAHAVGVASGSDALYLALRASGVEPGDVVVTTPLSFIATAEAIVRAAARPRFVDVLDERLCLDPEAVAAYLEGCRRDGEGLRDPDSQGVVRAIVPVHLYGRLADVEALARLARRHRLALVQDAAQAIGARPAGGSLAQTGPVCLSFFPAKNLGAWGDGGAVLTDDAAIADSVRRLRVHGRSEPQRYLELGINSRLDEIQAAVLHEKLRWLDEDEASRRRHAARYQELLGGMESGLRLPPPLAEGEVAHLHTVRVLHGRRDALAAHLSARGIETGVYYPRLLCDQPALAPHFDVAVPRARRAAAEVLSLPIHAGLDEGALERVTGAIDAFLKEA